MRWELIADSGYMVSTEGGVCLPLAPAIHNRHTPVKQRSDGRGYLCVDIKVNYQTKTVKVHTLVAETFLGPTPQGYHIDHLDHDKTNNRLDNLRWRKASDNSADCKRGSRNHKANPPQTKGGRLITLFSLDHETNCRLS